MKAASGDDRMADGKFASRFLQVTAKRQDAKVTIAIFVQIFIHVQPPMPSL